MIGLSFSALVAACRLDFLCFALTASADFLAAFCAARAVQPLPLAPPVVNERAGFKKKE